MPQFKHVIWGGTRIGAFKGIDLGCHTHVGESWELSGLAGHESVVAMGDEAGIKLPELIAIHGTDLVGERLWREHGTRFPLLFKLLDATLDLSVQVHPDKAMARSVHGGTGKSEMWYVIAAEPGTRIAAGLHREYTRDELANLVAEHRIMDAVEMYDVAQGDVYDLPAGTIHMLGAGCLALEVQQASDITYRLWDYDRIDSDGNRRELHTELALQAIDCTSVKCKQEVSALPGEVVRLVKRPEYDVMLVDVDGTTRHELDSDTCHVLMCVAGEVTLTAADGVTERVKRGDTLLMPSGYDALVLQGKARLISVKP